MTVTNETQKQLNEQGYMFPTVSMTMIWARICVANCQHHEPIIWIFLFIFLTL